MGTVSFPGVKCGRGVLLTTHPLLVPRSWKSRAIPLHTLWATHRASNGITKKRPSGHYMYHQFNNPQVLHSAHTLYLCVLCGSQKKNQLFPNTALTDWFFNNPDRLGLLRGTDWVFQIHLVRHNAIIYMSKLWLSNLFIILCSNSCSYFRTRP